MTTVVHSVVLYTQLALPSGPTILDVRTEEERRRVPFLIPGALRARDGALDALVDTQLRARKTVVYCGDGATCSAAVVEKLGALGVAAMVLEGGLDGWLQAGLPTVKLRSDYLSAPGSRWITRERPKIDRLACPWLIRRFIDPLAQFFFTPPQRVRSDAHALHAEPFDIDEVTFTHRGERCSFDAFLLEFDLKDPPLDALADIVRAADTATLERSREAAGLLAISSGLGINEAEDVVLLEQAMMIYDALYAWCKTAPRERHGWPKAAKLPAHS